MKKMVAGGLVGLAVGLVMPGVLAQAPQGEVQKWEQFCEPVGGNKMLTKNVPEANASMRSHGENGYQLVSATKIIAARTANAFLLCYRRPVR